VEVTVAVEVMWVSMKIVMLGEAGFVRDVALLSLV